MKKGWEVKELAAVSAINYGYTESATSEPVGPRFLRITDIQDDRVDWGSVPYCKIESADLPKYRLASGDIVFARTGATTGKSFLVSHPPNAVFASYLIRLRLFDKKLLPEFVSFFFQTDGYWKSIEDGSAGSAQGGFNATKLGALTIPVPPLPEQRRIVGILDEAFEGIATAKANTEKNLENARALFESHLQSVFTRRGKGWIDAKLGDVCHKITDGTRSLPPSFGQISAKVKL
ncbi:MAG: restriction endonuclease subunit S [Nitrospirae bacterium]|nr:restriction endonuclease subunit S [Nitrospirota bacterium]